MATENVKQVGGRPSIATRGAGLYQGLMRVAAPHLSDDELSAISDQTDDVRNVLGHVTATATGLANLIVDDEDVGSFRGREELSKLLWLLSDCVQQADSLLAVAADAELELQRRATIQGAARV